MTSSEKIQSILSAECKNYAVYPDFHCGKGENYITHEIITEQDAMFADDSPHEQIDTLRVHIFTKQNPTIIKKAVRAALRLGGFSISYTEQFRESDTSYNHVIIQVVALGEAD